MRLKPPLRQINQRHPAARGLVFAYCPFGVEAPRDLISGLIGVGDGPVSLSRMLTNEIGVALDFPGASYNEYAQWSNDRTTLLPNTSPITLTTVMRVDSGITHDMDLLACGSPFRMFFYWTGSFPQLRAWANTSSSYPQSYLSAAIPYNQWIAVSGVWTGTTAYAPWIIVNGTTPAQTRLDGSGTISATGTQSTIGSESSGAQFAGAIGAVFAHSRALSLAEIAALHADPFGMFRRPRRIPVMVPEATAEAVTGSAALALARPSIAAVGTAGATCAVSGTLDGSDESDVVAGGQTLILTLTGTTWVPS